jgi:steroid delta-isomerase-like uncharacterized protein
MTAAETTALITRYYDAFNRGDTEGMLALVAEDIVHDVNQGERRVGKERFHAFCARMSHHYRERLDSIAIMVDADGRRAAAEFNVNGTYLVTDEGLPEAKGQTYRLPAGAFFVVEDGRIRRVTTYYNLTEWIIQVSG